MFFRAYIVSIAAGVALGCSPPPLAPQSPTTVTVPNVSGPVTPEFTSYHCDGTPFQIERRDYCAYDTPSSWREAQRICDGMFARLLSFDSEEQHQTIATAFGPAIAISSEAYWIGLYEIATNEGHWYWVDSSELKYTHWNQGEPNDDGSNEDCAEWKVGTGSWNDAPCWAERKYICQQKDTQPLTCVGTKLRMSQGELCFSAEPADWETAHANCKSNGGRLLTLPTQEQDMALHKAVGPKLGLPSIWIGYNDLIQEGNWRWASTSRYVPDTWKSGEPNDFRDDEDCAQWFPEDGQMNDLSCSAKLPFVCERIEK